MQKVRASESKGKWRLLLPAQPWASESLGCRRAPTSSLAAREHLGPRNTGSLPQLSAGLLQGQPPGGHRSDGPQPLPRVPASHCPGPKGRGSPFRQPPQRVRGQQTGSGKGGQGLGVPQGGGPPSAHSPGARPRAVPCPLPIWLFWPPLAPGELRQSRPLLGQILNHPSFHRPWGAGGCPGAGAAAPVPSPGALPTSTFPGHRTRSPEPTRDSHRPHLWQPSPHLHPVLTRGRGGGGAGPVMHVCLRSLGSFPGLCPPECRCQRVTLPQPSIDPGAKMVLGTGRGVGWPPSQEPRQWEPPQLQTPGGDVLPPAWVAEMLRGSESPPCTPPGPWRSPQQVLELPLDRMWPCSTAWAGREGGLAGLVASRWSTGRLLPAVTALRHCPRAAPSAAPPTWGALGHLPAWAPTFPKALPEPLPHPLSGSKGCAGSLCRLQPAPAGAGGWEHGHQGASGHVSGLGSAQAHPWGRQLGSQALALSPRGAPRAGAACSPLLLPRCCRLEGDSGQHVGWPLPAPVRPARGGKGKYQEPGD